MDFTNYTVHQFQLFMLMAFRISGIFLIGPFFNDPGFSPVVKIGLAMLVTMVVFPLVATSGVFVPQTTGALAVAAVLEFGLGALVGWAATFVFAGISLGGHFVSQDMGITIANVIDPVSQSQTSIVGQLQTSFVTLLFVLMGGPNLLIAIFYRSFTMVPLLGFQLNHKVVEYVSGPMMQNVFELGVKAAAPVMAGLLITTVAMGFIARTVPELNIFVLGFALRLGIGLFLLVVSLEMFGYLFEVHVRKMVQDLYVILNLAR